MASILDSDSKQRDLPASATIPETLTLSSKQVPFMSGLHVLAMGRQLITIMVIDVTSMILRLIMMPTIPLLVHSVHPDEDILRRNKANDTFDQTEAIMVKTAEM